MSRLLAWAGMAAKEALAYRAWILLRVFVAGVAMVIASYLWRAVYAGTPSIAGIDGPTALTYVLLAEALAGAGQLGMVRRMAFLLREGQIAHELLRPIDLQLARSALAAGSVAVALASRLPLLALAVWLGADLPADPLRWLAFLGSFAVGACAMFAFEWIVACLAFYTTDVWGIMVLNEALALFFGGVLFPLDLMPGWLRVVADALPYRQTSYLPVSLLAGVKPLAAAPGVVAGQLAWALGLLVLSRLAFARASRVVTVQGG
ncbi:MAG: ABC-2 family transporter protein [Anaeromyxobacteraceae bacterium]